MTPLKALPVSTISHAGKSRMGLEFGVGKDHFYYLSQGLVAYVYGAKRSGDSHPRW